MNEKNSEEGKSTYISLVEHFSYNFMAPLQDFLFYVQRACSCSQLIVLCPPETL